MTRKRNDRKEIRRKQAEARQAEYDKLSPAEKLKRLDHYSLTATRERARLDAILNPPKSEPEKKPPE